MFVLYPFVIISQPLVSAEQSNKCVFRLPNNGCPLRIDRSRFRDFFKRVKHSTQTTEAVFSERTDEMPETLNCVRRRRQGTKRHMEVKKRRISHTNRL